MHWIKWGLGLGICQIWGLLVYTSEDFYDLS